MAILFAVAGLFGPLPIFQANQVTQIVRDVILIPNGLTSAGDSFTTDLISGLVILSIVSLVIFGGIKRIGKVASKMVPAMVVIYVSCVLYILAVHFGDLGHYLSLIVTDAFKGEYFNPEAAGGGAIGALIVHGTKRAAFSNEAGIGTATLAHGAAKTKEPVREGLVAMMGPFIDTLLVCTMTALANSRNWGMAIGRIQRYHLNSKRIPRSYWSCGRLSSTLFRIDICVQFSLYLFLLLNQMSWISDWR